MAILAVVAPPDVSRPTLERAGRSKPIHNLQLVESLCQASAVLREARRIHVKSFGALIPHVFMGDVLARVGACIPAARLQGELLDILEVLERGMTAGDRETRNVIAVSFVGDGELEPFFAKLHALLGPKVRAHVQGKQRG
jgi:hypothetical protein